jgi:hypothetical protein
MSDASERPLPDFTLIVEWENAEDVAELWVRRAVQALEAELSRCQARLRTRPRLMYLFDEETVRHEDITAYLAAQAPKLADLCRLETIPTPGLTYYQLKNFGAQQARTDLVVMVDSDAAPQPGWLPAILAPFSDPEVMAVGGFTTMGTNDFVSRTMALSWIFDLPSERTKSARRKKIHANNCAFRRSFFVANPWPDLPAFKKQCGFWLRDIEARGIKWVREVDAITVHAPQPGIRFLVWRAWTAGHDRDFQGAQVRGLGRVGRAGYVCGFAAAKIGRAFWRIAGKGGEVELPLWQRPAAMLLALGYYELVAIGGVWSALTRAYEPLRAR